jgi:hypothetical protein
LYFLGWSTFVTELYNALSNRITGFPSQSELASFYRSIGVVHHGSQSIDVSVLKAQVVANFDVPNLGSAFAALGFCAFCIIGATVLDRGRSHSKSVATRGRADIWLFVRLLIWTVGIILTPIALFPAFAQEVTLRGSGASLFFISIGVSAILAYAFKILCYFVFFVAELLRSPAVMAAEKVEQISTEQWPTFRRLAGILLILIGLFGIAPSLLSVAAQIKTDWLSGLKSIYLNSAGPSLWQPLSMIESFRSKLFMTNINAPLVGFLAQAPGFGVCSPRAIVASGEIEVSYCKVAHFRRFEHWTAQRPALFFYFDDARLFPGFAECVPTGTLIGAQREGSDCMRDLLDRLSSQYRVIAKNRFVRVFDLSSPK